MAVATGAVFGIQGWWKSSGAAFDEASIAVLPFDNLEPPSQGEGTSRRARLTV